MFATEPFGTWGPGPAPEPVGGWARFVDSLANDPQAVATIVAAFLGFLFGVLIKYGLDRRADRLRRETDRRILATALRAELVSLDMHCSTRIEAFEELLKVYPGMKVIGGPEYFARMALPPRQVWAAHLGRIGELEGFDPDALILVYGSFDNYDLAVETMKYRAGDQGATRKGLQDRVDQLKRVRSSMLKAGGLLIDQTVVARSWWRRILRFNGHSTNAASGDST